MRLNEHNPITFPPTFLRLRSHCCSLLPPPPHTHSLASSTAEPPTAVAVTHGNGGDSRPLRFPPQRERCGGRTATPFTDSAARLSSLLSPPFWGNTRRGSRGGGCLPSRFTPGGPLNYSWASPPPQPRGRGDMSNLSH